MRVRARKTPATILVPRGPGRVRPEYFGSVWHLPPREHWDARALQRDRAGNLITQAWLCISSGERILAAPDRVVRKLLSSLRAAHMIEVSIDDDRLCLRYARGTSLGCIRLHLHDVTIALRTMNRWYGRTDR